MRRSKAVGRAQASPRKHYDLSVRAGTEQDQLNDGARGEGAARDTKTHVRTTSGGAESASTIPSNGGGETSGAGQASAISRRQACSTGADAATAVDDGEVNSPSATPHESPAHDSGEADAAG